MVESDWFKHALSIVHHPVALVGTDNRFEWVNGAFERLVGYSSAELVGQTWMSITVHEDVGGDLAATESVIKGERTNYTTAKKYKHKSGEEVPIALTVWRYPQGSGEMVGFSVEAVSLESHASQLDAINKRHQDEIAGIVARLETIEAEGRFWLEAKRRCAKWWPVIAVVGAVVGWLVNLAVGLIK